MNAVCPNCSTTFHRVDRDEDGFPFIEAEKCASPTCDVWLCRAGCQDEERSFACDLCHGRLCIGHRIRLYDMSLCPHCAMAEVEAAEPSCTCSQTDVDLFDARGCELHDRRSAWNETRRAVTWIYEYEQQKGAA